MPSKSKSNSKAKSKSKPSIRRARSAPRRSRSKSSKRSKQSIRRARSAPGTSRKSKSSSQKKRKQLAESVYGRFQSPAEVEMKYLKTKHDKYGSVKLGSLEKKKLKSLKNKEETRQKSLLKKMKGTRGIAIQQLETLGPRDIPYMRGLQDSLGKDNPDPILGQLDCKERGAWCSTNREQRDYCKRQEVHDLYILPCILNVNIDKKIKNEIIMTELTDIEDYNENIDRVHHLYPHINNLKISEYLSRYLSFGSDYGNQKLKMIIRCDFVRNPILGELRFPSGEYQSWPSRVVDKLGISRWVALRQAGIAFEGNIWTEDLFLELCRCISPEEMHSLIDQWYNADKEDRELSYTSIKQTMSFYQEDSLAWWISAFLCDIYAVPDTVVMARGVPVQVAYPVDPIYQLLMDMEDSSLEVFSGASLQNNWSWFRREIKLLVPGKLNGIIAWLRNPKVKDENLQNFMEFKDLFLQEGVGLGMDKLRLLQAFDEFTDLLYFYPFNNPKVDQIEEELGDFVKERMIEDLKD